MGRGPSSNKGKTSGRGMNGQKSRTGSATKHITGGQTKLYMKLPKLPNLKPNKSDRLVISYDEIEKHLGKTEIIDIKKIKNIFNKKKIKEVKIIAGKLDIKPRKYGKNIILSKSIKGI